MRNATKYNHISIALPVLDENKLLPNLLNCLDNQTFKLFDLYICINQPEAWWDDNEKIQICKNNCDLLKKLQQQTKSYRINIIDRCTKNNGWRGKQRGVGWARKVLIDEICCKIGNNELIISLDADTVFENNYFESVVQTMNSNPNAVAISLPYYHKLSKETSVDKAMLRYEIYMRYYSINMFRIKSPYSFTALGSAMAFPVSASKAVGGLTPKPGGEDFYFLQKLCKYGQIIQWNDECVFPATRFSDRVDFGTGPAMIKGNNGDWTSYPIYPFSFFDEIYKSYQLFETLFEKDVELPISNFLKTQSKTNDLWSPLRKNFQDVDHFIKGCHEKLDGLRILQYLKTKKQFDVQSDEQCLFSFLNKFYPEAIATLNLNSDTFTFEKSTVSESNSIRNYLMKIENSYRKNNV